MIYPDKWHSLTKTLQRGGQMAIDTLAVNSQNLTEDEYRQLCKQVRQYQLTKGKGKKKTKPILKPIGSTITIDKKLTVQQTPVDWDDVQNGTPFALDPNGTLIYTKAGSSRALCLNTMSTVPVGGASVYRIFF
jgi:hypothetical protein